MKVRPGLLTLLEEQSITTTQRSARQSSHFEVCFRFGVFAGRALFSTSSSVVSSASAPMSCSSNDLKDKIKSKH